MKTDEERKAQMRAYYWANREKLIAYNKQYRKTYKRPYKKLTSEEKLKKAAYNKAYRDKNKEKINSKRKAWLAKHPGYMANYLKNYRNKEKDNENVYLANKVQAILGQHSNRVSI